MIYFLKAFYEYFHIIISNLVTIPYIFVYVTDLFSFLNFYIYNKHTGDISIFLNLKYLSNCRWTTSAPLRTITVRDIMSDLPEIKNGAKKEELTYGSEPESHFQKLVSLFEIFYPYKTIDFEEKKSSFKFVAICNVFIHIREFN